MALEHIADRVLETDVLVMGGGIAGCCVAAKAAEHGLNVTLAEKSKTDRAGNAAMGTNYYVVGAKPREGLTALELVKQWTATLHQVPTKTGLPEMGRERLSDLNILYEIWDKGLWAVEELEKLGVPMKWPDGEYRYVKDQLRTGKFDLTLSILWTNVKPIMAAAVKKRGVNVLDRTMVVDLLNSNGKVVGATAVNTRTGQFIVIKAKAVVIATGLFSRIYNGDMPQTWNYKFHYHWNPATVSGDGYAAAYRVGAELANMNMTGHGYIVDELAMGAGLLGRTDGVPGKILTWRGEEVTMTNARTSISKLAEMEQKGRTPLYMSGEDLPDDYHKRVEVALRDMRLASLKLAEDRGFNPRTHRYEISPIAPFTFYLAPGVNIDRDYKSLLDGVYTVGDCAAGLHGAYMAAPCGFILGENLPSITKNAGEPVIDEAQVESQKQAVLAPMAVKDGTEPMELECAIRYICDRYVTMFKSEGKLREGLRRLGSLRREFLPRLMAKNPHYLMRCLEVRNLMDLAEVHINACLERKETRGNYIRLDYPEMDRTWDNMITIQRLENGKPVVEKRLAPDLEPEYAKEEK